MRMHGVGEVDRIVGARGFLDGFVGLEKLPPRLGGRLARHDRRLVVDGSQAMEQGPYAAFRRAQAELLLDQGGHWLGYRVQIAPQVHVEPGQARASLADVPTVCCLPRRTLSSGSVT